MQKIKQSIGQAIAKAWAPTLMITIVFFISLFAFGAENTIIGPFITLSFLHFRETNWHIGCMLKNLAIYICMAIAASLALTGAVACLLVNAAAVFWIAYFLINEYEPTNYIPTGLALIFFQNSPVEGVGILRRIGALAAAFAVMLVFRLFDRRKRGSKSESLHLEGLAAAQALCAALQDGEREQAKLQLGEIYRIACALSKQLHQQNRAETGRTVVENKYSSSVTLLLTIYARASTWLEQEELPTQEELTHIHALTVQLEQACEHTPLDRIYLRINKLDMRSFRLRFALRQVCVITPCLLFSYLTGFTNSYWLAISVFVMMIPLYDETPKRIAQRMKGTLFGILISLVLFALVEDYWPRVALMTVFNFFIYASESYTAVVTYITGSAMSLNFTESNYLLMFVQRGAYTMIGAVIAWLANSYIFPIRAKYQLQYLVDLLLELEQQAIASRILPSEEHRAHMNQYAIRSLLLIMRVESYCDIVGIAKSDRIISMQSHLQAIAQEAERDYVL